MARLRPHRRSVATLAVAVALIGVLVLGTGATACSSGDGDTAADDPAIAATVHITDGEFDPRVVEIEPGGTVMWINDDVNDHGLRFLGKKFESPRIRKGRSWVHTFSTSGEFRYYDPARNTMKGLVVVRPAS